MHYSAREVEKLLRLPGSTVRALVKEGFVQPERGARRSLRFSFQDLIVLRTAQALVQSGVPARRIVRSLRELRRQLPEAMPLSGLRIGAVGDRVVVQEGAARRHAETGQYLLAFEGDPARGALSVVTPPAAAARMAPAAADDFAQASELEANDPQAAQAAYERAIAADPSHLHARINLGRLLHESGRLAQAERAYRAGLQHCGDQPLLHYNLGVLLEDCGRKSEALAAYQAALRADPALADCHYNLALLCEQLSLPKDALRHMAQYRRLSGG